MTAGHASVISRCFPVLKIIASAEKHDNTGMNRDSGVMSRCFPVLKIIASAEKHDNTGMSRDTTGSNWGSPWTFSVFVF